MPTQCFEELRGVIIAEPTGVLTLEEYLALGVRQSIFSAEQRALLHVQISGLHFLFVFRVCVTLRGWFHSREVRK